MTFLRPCAVLLRVEGDAGHGLGSTRTQAVEELADSYAFLLATLRPPTPWGASPAA